MTAISIAASGGLDHLQIVEPSHPGSPGAGEIGIRLRASSLNSHDDAVAAASSRLPTGASPWLIETASSRRVGEGVEASAAGDAVGSWFFPLRQDGPAAVGDSKSTPGDGIDGYAREAVVRPASWLTPAPRGWSHAEAATLTIAGLTA